MIHLNFEPIISNPNYPYKIVFTDSTVAEDSEVWVFHDTAIKRDSLVWLEIFNLDYQKANEEEPAGPDNELEDHPYYIIAQWVYVKDVLANAYPEVRLDEEGEPILSGGVPILDLTTNGNGPVKVVFAEHKSVMEFSYCDSSINLLSNYSMILRIAQNSSIRFPEYLFRMTWEDICNYLSFDRCKLDYKIPDPEDEEAEWITNPAYPVSMPQNLQFRGLPKSDAIEFLRRNHEVRLLSKPMIVPKKESLIPDDDEQIRVDEAELLTHLQWTIRKPLEYHEDVIYQRLLRSVKNPLTDADIEASGISFPEVTSTIQNYQSFYPFNFGVRYEGEALANVSGPMHNFRCNCYFFWNVGDNNPNYDMESISDYITETRKNVTDFYEFVCGALPHDFFYDYEWSRIEYRNYEGNPEIQVNHFPRQSITTEDTPFIDVPVTNVSGLIVGITTDYLAVSDFYDEDRKIAFGSQVLYLNHGNAVTFLDRLDIEPSDTETEVFQHYLTGRRFTGKFGGVGAFNNLLTITSVESSDYFPDVSAYLINGEEITGISQNITGLNTIDEGVFQPSEMNPIFHYEIDDSKPDYELDESVPYKVTNESNNLGLLAGIQLDGGPEVNVNTTVHLKMVITDVDDIKDYITERATTLNRPIRDDLATALAEAWKDTLSTISFTVRRSTSVSINEVIVPSFSQGTFGDVPNMLTMDMDVDNVLFTSYGKEYPINSSLSKTAVVTPTAAEVNALNSFISSFPNYPIPTAADISRLMRELYLSRFVRTLPHTITITTTPIT